MKLLFGLITGVRYNELLNEVLVVQCLIMEQWINTQSKQKSDTATTKIHIKISKNLQGQSFLY